MKCKRSDCFHCPYPDCINDKPLPEITAERREQSNRFHAKKRSVVQRTRHMHTVYAQTRDRRTQDVPRVPKQDSKRADKIQSRG